LDNLLDVTEGGGRCQEAREEQKQTLDEVLDTLSERGRYVLSEIRKGKELKEIGQILNLSPSRVHQIKRDAIMSLREELGIEIEDTSLEFSRKNRVEDGELLLAHILSKSTAYQIGNYHSKRRDLSKIVKSVNDIYHGKPVRSRILVKTWLDGKHYESRLKSLRDKYFSKSK